MPLVILQAFPEIFFFDGMKLKDGIVERKPFGETPKRGVSGLQVVHHLIGPDHIVQNGAKFFWRQNVFWDRRTTRTSGEKK